jgi:hypothetical protein
MFKFDSYAPVKEKVHSVPQRYSEEDEMDWDEEYGGGGKTGAATPGETIASSNDFMRWDTTLLCCPCHLINFPTGAMELLQMEIKSPPLWRGPFSE